MSIAKYVTTTAVWGALALAAGCQGRASIPSGANEVQAGTGRISYTAHHTGNVFVLDHDKDKKVFEGRLKRDDQIIVEPDQDKIVVAGENADHNESLKEGHRYGIYFTQSD